MGARPGDQLVREHQKVGRTPAAGSGPGATRISNESEARHALFALVGARQLLDAALDYFLGVNHRNAEARRVTGEALPMAMKLEGAPAVQAQRGKDSPAHQQSRLARREASLIEGNDAIVVND